MSHWQDDIRRRIAELRGRIRKYVLLEGLAVAVVLLGAWFWLTYLLDIGYFGATKLELPGGVRTFALVAGVAALVGVAGTWVATRVLRPLRTESLALLIERRFPALEGRLMTAIRPHAGEGELATAMVERTEREAADRLRDVEVADVLNFGPLRKWLVGAGVLAASVVTLGVANAEGMSRWADAYLWQRDGYWDRFRKSELTLAVVRPPDDTLVPFEGGPVRHARGGNLTLLASVPDGRKVPDRVTLSVRTAASNAIDQEITMTRAGERTFRHTVLKVSEDVEVDLRGGDYATSVPYYVEVVDPPQVEAIRLAADYPDYTGLDEATASETLVQSPTVSLPAGTAFEIRVAANKPLSDVTVRSREGTLPEDAAVELAGDGFTLRGVLGPAELLADADGTLLGEEATLEFTLTDADGLVSPRPAELTFRSEADRPPVVVARPSGIGSAVTRKARVPFEGAVEDDYGLTAAWFDVASKAPADESFAGLPRGAVDVPVEGRKQVELTPERVALDLRGYGLTLGQQLRLTMTAVDGNTLPQPNTGRGESLSLRVVSDDELLAMLYDKELNLRSRFERIIEEVTETRTNLDGASARLRESDDQDARNAAAAAVEQGVLAVRKNETETAAVAELFRDIRAELVNNRVDTDETLDRIDRGVLAPLDRVLEREFPEADRATLAARAASRAGDAGLATSLDNAVGRLDRLIARLEAVLTEMSRRQSYNQLIKQLQLILDRQKDLKERTEEKSVDDFFDDLVP